MKKIIQFRMSCFMLLLYLFFVGDSLAQPESRCSIQNQLSKSVYINNKPENLTSKVSNVSRSGEFTVSFWFKPNMIPEGKTINILKIRNPAPKHEKMSKEKKAFVLKTNYPECPVSPSLVKSDPNYALDPLIKDNPNCFPENLIFNDPKKPIKAVDLIEKVLEVDVSKAGDGKLIFDFPASFNSNSKVVSYLTESLQGIGFDSKEWVFVALSFDYPNNMGKLYVFNYKLTNKEHKLDFALSLPEFSVKKGFTISYSDNKEIKDNSVYGFLYDINMFYMYLKHLDLLKLFNYDSYTQMLQNIRVELLFDAKDVKKPLVATGESPKRYFVEGSVVLDQSGYLFKDKSKIKIGKLDTYPIEKLVSTIAFYFTITLRDEVNNGFVLITGESDENEFMLRLVRDDLENSLYYALEASIGDIKYKTPRFVEINELSMFTFSIIVTDSKYLTFYFSNGRKLYDVSAVYKKVNFDLRNLNYTLFSDKGNRGEVLINRFIILDDPLPSIIAVQNNVLMESCNRNCEIPLDPHSTAKSCLQCKNSVVLPVDNHCVEFCPPNTKNSNGVCVSCRESMCKEIFPGSLTISRLNNTAFIIELDKRINQFETKKIDSLFDIQIEGLIKEKDYDFTLTAGSSKILLVNFNFKNSFYNKVLSVSTNFTDFDHVYNEDRNFIYSLESKYRIPVVHFLNHQSELITVILAEIIFIIFIATILIGMFLLVLSFKYNLNEPIVKKFSVLFRDKQLLPLLLFLHIVYPSNLHNFLSHLYAHVIGFNAVIAPFTDEIYLIGSEIPHPNFFDRQLTSLFLQNFGVIFILHCIILALFILITILGLFYSCFSIRMKELLLKIKDSFEYNVLIVSFVVFDFQIFIFANLDFQHPVLTNSFTHLSFYIAVAYIAFFVLFIIGFTISHFKNSYFVPQSDLKFKLSFMFIGYRNRPLPNYYEVIILVMNFLTASILVYLRSLPLPQVSAFIALMVIYLTLTLTIKPYEENTEGKLESFNRIILVSILIFIAALAVNDINLSYNTTFRETVGWLIITLIVCYILVNFIMAFYHLVHFVIRINRSSKLIFYDKDEGFNSVDHMRHDVSGLGNTTFKEDMDLEERQVTKSNLGKLGNLGDKIDGSIFFTERRISNNMMRININDSISSDNRRYYSYSNSSINKENSEPEERSCFVKRFKD